MELLKIKGWFIACRQKLKEPSNISMQPSISMLKSIPDPEELSSHSKDFNTFEHLLILFTLAFSVTIQSNSCT